MYAVFMDEEPKEIQDWLNSREKEGYKLVSTTNIANRGVFDVVVIMHKDEEQK